MRGIKLEIVSRIMVETTIMETLIIVGIAEDFMQVTMEGLHVEDFAISMIEAMLTIS